MSKILLIGSSEGIGLTFYYTRLAIVLKNCGNDVIVLSGRKEQYAELPYELSRSGIKRVASNNIDNLDWLGFIAGSKAIRRILKKEKNFDVIHVGGAKQSAKVFLATRRINRKPKTFATISSLPNSKVGMSIASMSYRLFCDKCVSLCNHGKDTLTGWGVNSDKICVIPLFSPDLEWFDKAKKVKTDLANYHLQDITSPVVFYAASHFRHKGFSHYLMAASKILNKFDATFVVGGKGPLTSSLKNLAQKLGISKHVVFTGWITNYHMPHLLSDIADVCVSTSLVEQLPSYVMECMAAGKPVIASNVGGVPEVITNGVNGYLISPSNFGETADRIVDLIDNPEKAKEMGLSGRKLVERTLNMKSSVLELIKAYGELRGNKSVAEINVSLVGGLSNHQKA